MGGIRNEYIGGKAQAVTKLERRVQRMDSGYNSRQDVEEGAARWEGKRTCRD